MEKKPPGGQTKGKRNENLSVATQRRDGNRISKRNASTVSVADWLYLTVARILIIR
jgi:hypothetical protein